MSFVINPTSTAGPVAIAQNSKGLGTFVPEMSGFTTTTAKDAGKRIFNFTQQQNQMATAAQATSAGTAAV